MRLRAAVLALAVIAPMTAATPAHATATTSACTSASMIADFPSPRVPGDTITFTASSTTCSTPEYKFFLKAPGGTLTPQTGFGGGTWAWNTAGLKGGIFGVGVWARETGSAADFEAYWIGTYELFVSKCTAASISTVDTTWPNVIPGSSMHFVATGTGCSYETRFWLKKPGGSWRMVRDYGIATWTWNTKGYPNGTYLLGVWVRDPASPRAYDAYDIATYYLGDTPNCTTGLTFHATPSAPQVPGTIVTFTARSMCGGPYKFWMRRPGGTWKVVLAYGSNSVLGWDTTGYPSGTYEIGVWEKMSGFRIPYSSYAIITYRLDVGQCGAGGLLPDKASPQAPGTTVTFNAWANYCSMPTFEFWILPPGGTWVVIQPYGTGSSLILNTTGAPDGPIQVGVWERQTGSNASYDAYAIITFWLGS